MKFPYFKTFWRSISVLVAIGLACYAAMCYACTQPAREEARPNLEMDVTGIGVEVLQHNGFVAGYDESIGQSRWVVWELNDKKLDGPYNRKDFDFGSDPLLLPSKRVERGDYKGSGYSRGHLCPAADMKWSAEAMRDCHYMTNICPQDQTLNGKWWEHLEKACRRWADNSHEGQIWIAAGPIFNTDEFETIGKSVKIAVPDGFYKVVVSLREGHEKGIGFIYRNNDSRQTMEDAARTIAHVERVTGLTFFPQISEDLKKQKDLRAWN